MADERAEEIGYFLRERVPYFFLQITKMIYILEYMHFLLPFSNK